MSQSQLSKDKSTINNPLNSNLSISANKANHLKKEYIKKESNSHQRCTTQVENL